MQTRQHHKQLWLGLWFALALLGGVGRSLRLTPEPAASAAPLACTPNPVVTATADSGAGSLRQALTDVCANGTITFNLPANSTITLNSGSLVIDKSLTLSGPGAQQLTVRRGAGGTYRIFNIPNAGLTVALSGLTLRDGSASNFGGGIYSASALTLTDCVLANNQSVTGGGGVYVAFANGNFSGCTFDGNSSAQGGAIQFQGQSNTLTLSNCTLHNNSATENGSGAALLNVSATGSSTVQLTNCTVADNAPSASFVGGIASRAINGNLQPVNTLLRNTLLANNSVPSLAPGVAGGTFTSQGNNLASDNGNNLLNGAGDLTNTNPLLGALTDNGGTTPTRALLPGSPAINAGSATSAPTQDQRGIARVGNVDIGAFESRGFTLSVVSGSGQTAGLDTPFANALVAAVSSANNEPVTGGQVRFTAPGSGASASLSGSPATINAQGRASVTATANGQAGSYQVAAASNGALGGVNFALTNFSCPALSVTPPSLSPGIVGQAYSQSVSANGGATPYQFSVTGLPQGLTMASNGVITGTPNVGGTFTLNVSVTDNNGCPGTGTVTLVISCTTLSVTPLSLPPGTVGQAYNQSVAANGGATPYQFSATGLPQGLTMASNGALSGTPNETGTFTLRVSVRDNNGCTGSGSVSLVITCASVLTFEVNDLGDAPDATLNNLCATTDNKCTLRAALQEAVASSCPTAINISATGTINLDSALPEISRSLAINGPGASQLTVRRAAGGDYSLFVIPSGVAVTVQHLTLADGGGAVDGGAIYNQGTLTVSDCAFSGNTARNGAAINSPGALNLSRSVFTNNTAQGFATVWLTNQATVSDCTFAHNHGADALGSIGGALTLARSTFKGNELYAVVLLGGTHSLVNCTFSENGGGLRQADDATTTVTNATFNANASSFYETNVVVSGGVLRLKNSIMANSFHSQCGAAGGTLISEGNNLDTDNTCNLTQPTDKPNLNWRLDPNGNDPLLGPLGNYGGFTETHPLLPSSPALNAGNNAGAPATDQRGIARPQSGTVDMGAFESRGFTLAVVSGSGQSTSLGSLFPLPLVVSVTANDPVEPLAGGRIFFTPPATGAGAKLPPTAPLNANEQASNPVTANLYAGSYQVAASAGSGNTVNFNLTNTCVSAAPVVSNKNDSGPGSLRQALADACGGALITFAPNVTGTLTLTSGELPITRPLTVRGPGANVLTISGNNQARVFHIVEGTLEVTLSGLTIANGYHKTPDVVINGLYVGAENAYGGGIYNESLGTVNVTNCVLTNNRAQGGNATGLNSQNVAAGVGYGGAISHRSSVGTLNVTGCRFTNNHAFSGTASGGSNSNYVFPSEGGAAFGQFEGTINFNQCSFTGNSAARGGAISNRGSMTLAASTVSANKAFQDWGGGVYDSGMASTIINTTVTGNLAEGEGAGIWLRSFSRVITNCTITDNHGGQFSFGGGGIYGLINPALQLKNTIIAGNTGGASPDLKDLVTSLGNNLIGDGSGANGLTNGVNGDQLGTTAAPLDPKLGPLANNGGPTLTHRLLPGSPALNAGTSSGAPASDQRGVARDNQVDIGAVEVSYALAATGGTPQSTALGTAFALPLQATLTENGLPFSGVPVTFNAPGSGASATFPHGATVNTDAQGRASVTAVANPLPGSYSVLAAASGITAVNFELTNACPTLSLAALPAATAGVAYSQTLMASPAGGNYSFALAPGASLPPGLTALAANGWLAGTPTQAGTFSFNVVVNGFGVCTQTLPVTLTVVCPALTLAPATLPNGATGQPYAPVNFSAAPAGTNYSFAVTGGQLPPGLSLSSNGTLSGTPTAGGVFTFTVTARGWGNGQTSCSGARQYTLLVVAICPTLTLTPVSLPGGTVGAAYPAQAFGVTGGDGPYSFAVTGGALPGGLSLSNNGHFSGTPNASGTFVFTITGTGAAGCSGSRSFTVVIGCPALTLTPVSLPGAQAGVAYSATVQASGATAYSVVSGNLPPGLNFNSATGALTGTATATGTYSFTVQATGAGGCSATQAYTLAVTCPTVTVNPASLPAGTVGTAYSQALSATPGGNVSFAVSSGNLPAGLSLSAAGSLSGTPTTQGTYTFTVTATAFGTCSSARPYTLTINGSCAPITLPALPTTGKVGVNYTGNLAATTPSASYTFTVESGTLPPGLLIDNLFAQLRGKPTAAGAYTFTLKATRSNGCSGTREYSVTISSALAALALSADYDGDGQSDLGVWSAGSGTWRIALSRAQETREPAWGGAGDVTLLGDYDGDGQTDLAVFRPREATFYIQRSGDGGYLIKQWGQATDVPVPGDYDGDGVTDLAVWRGSTGQWCVWRSSDEQAEITTWGLSRAPYLDLPVPGDYDGDGRTDLAVFRRQTGTWLIQRSRDGQTTAQTWGGATDVPVAADYDGDGQTDLAVWRGSTGEWFVLRSANGSYEVTAWGAAAVGDVPAPGDYDGDGKTDLAVWRASTQTWYVRVSQNGTVLTQPQGRANDVPLTRRPRF